MSPLVGYNKFSTFKKLKYWILHHGGNDLAAEMRFEKVYHSQQLPSPVIWSTTCSTLPKPAPVRHTSKDNKICIAFCSCKGLQTPVIKRLKKEGGA